MGAIDTQYTFTATDTITSTKMNNIIDQTTITTDAIIGTTLDVASGKLKIRSAGITSNELGVDSVKTASIENGAVTQEKASNMLVPAGAVMAFAMNGAPTGWLAANGAAVSRTTYATLFAAIGTTYGAGDGSTTFTLPDLRGEFVRGFDAGRGVDTGRTIGSAQLDAFQNITGTAGRFDSAFSGTTSSGAFTISTSTHVTGGGGAGTYSTVNFDASRVARTSTETRPRNIAMLYCIKI
jgi:microcystin-dependent protein